MRPWGSLGLALLGAGLAIADEVLITEAPGYRQSCAGMYSKQAWGGSVDPYVSVKFDRYTPENEQDPNQNPVVAAVVYEYDDEYLIGVPRPGVEGVTQYICDQTAVELNLCTSEEGGQFLLQPNSTAKSKSKIITKGVFLTSDERAWINYGITRTGYYCITTIGVGDTGFSYRGVAEFRNAYGELPGAQIAKLPFYGGLTLVYAVIGVFWAFLYVQNRSDILPVQNYITATIIFMVVEMSITWGYYDYMNVHGSNLGSKIFLIVVAILNAGRNSLSFFLLLIVCMGYGVSKTSLGKTMIYVRWLTIGHFVFGVIYAIASLTVSAEDAGPWILFVILPLAGTLTAFYVWTLNSLGATLKDLLTRKQHVKANMYKKLWWAILLSIVTIFLFFFINAFVYAGSGNPQFNPSHWQTRWFVLDGWMNIIYLIDFGFIAYLWRPTVNNRRFAMSDEIAQDDEGFEIASIRDSLDDEEANGGARPGGYAAMDSEPPSAVDGEPKLSHGARTESPLPAPKPQHPPPRPRESLDGETIFAVGDEQDSDSDDDKDNERKTLKKSD